MKQVLWFLLWYEPEIFRVAKTVSVGSHSLQSWPDISCRESMDVLPALRHANALDMLRCTDIFCVLCLRQD